jgi:hypothetical protein
MRPHALLTFASGAIAALRMTETLPAEVPSIRGGFRDPMATTPSAETAPAATAIRSQESWHAEDALHSERSAVRH